MNPNNPRPDYRPSEPRPFKAKRAGQCADGSPQCGGIKPGDAVVRLPVPAAFDRSPGAQRATGEMYYWLHYSHLLCYQRAEIEDAERKAKREEQE